MNRDGTGRHEKTRYFSGKRGVFNWDGPEKGKGRTVQTGVFNDAEQNIEDDAAYSMKARLEIQAQRAIERGCEVDQFKVDLAARSDVEVLGSQLDHVQEQIDALKRQQLLEELRARYWGHGYDRNRGEPGPDGRSR